MSDPQTWTIVLSLVSMVVTLAGIVVVMPIVNARTIGRELTGEIRRLDAKIDGVEQRLEARIDGVEQRLEARIDGVEQRLEARIDGVEQRLSTRIDAFKEVTEVRFSEVGRRLDTLEGDMSLVKGHLLGRASA